MRPFQHLQHDNIQVEAEQVGQSTYAPLALQLGAHVIKEVNKETREEFVGLNVLTPSGWVRASEGCWVVKTAIGVVVLTPGHFKQRYREIPTGANPAIDVRAERLKRMEEH